ncbi:hypothetical protein NDU88_010189 [Pleurodeles waltl]|uniref:Uncharacterized protein n=1 Tax=Pleurodeles waltl TaxID=8319 RepID=A0AAV7S0J3_PLEWA|nr:hypothetical protein NDU88_010189 [Pleurodeles waltl]
MGGTIGGGLRHLRPGSADRAADWSGPTVGVAALVVVHHLGHGDSLLRIGHMERTPALQDCRLWDQTPRAVVDIGSTYLLWGGGFNLALDPFMDRQTNAASSCTKAAHYMRTGLAAHGVLD